MATYWEGGCSFGLRCVSWYGCLIVSLVFSRLGFESGNLFLIAPFPDLCLLVPFHSAYDIFSWYKYLSVNLVFLTSVFGLGIFFRWRLFVIVAYLYFSIPLSLRLSESVDTFKKNLKTSGPLSDNVLSMRKTKLL